MDGAGGVAVSFEDVRVACGRIAGWAHRTPVITSRSLDELTGLRLALKAENLQRVGAFKFRGATNAVRALAPARAAAGVCTHSSGNHAAALALAARLAGIPAFVVMPSSAPAVKRAAVEGYGGRITVCEPGEPTRAAALAEVQAATGAVFIHPNRDPLVIAGQGTAAVELLEDAGPLDLVVTPVGGGGLLAGTAVAVAELAPGTRVLGAEPAGADDAARSLAAGHIVPSVAPRTIADGLLTSLNENTFPILQRLVAGIVTVSEAAIVEAMRLLWERTKLVVEPSGAVPLAAALEGRFPPGARVGLVLSGGNVAFPGYPGV